MTLVHTLRGSNSTSFTFVGRESHRIDAYTKEEKSFFFRKPCFALCLFSHCFMVLWYALLLSSHRAYVLDMHTSLYYCALLVACSDDHCSHFHMIFLVYDQVAHMFHIMFTWSHFTCYIILVLLSLDLPWGSNVFFASVSGYMYICSKCITTSHHFEGEKL